MSNAVRQQSTLFKGIYEFEDPSGSLIAAKVPPSGTVDLYNGTAVIVKPSRASSSFIRDKSPTFFLPALIRSKLRTYRS